MWSSWSIALFHPSWAQRKKPSLHFGAIVERFQFFNDLAPIYTRIIKCYLAKFPINPWEQITVIFTFNASKLKIQNAQMITFERPPNAQ